MNNERLKRIFDNVEKAWEFSTEKLYYPKTNMIYDFLMGESVEATIDCYPTAEEIAKSFPNPCGWGTGMEDSTLNLCSMLEAVVSRYEVTKEDDIKYFASGLIKGLITNGTISSESGFIARCVTPVDGKSYYQETSRDQYTNWIYAAHILLSSELATVEQKKIISDVLVNVAKKAERDVTSENGGCMLTLDGRRGVVACMDSPELCGHEALRLPMIYMAAFEASGDEYWLKKYQEIRERFLLQAEEKLEKVTTEEQVKEIGYIYGYYQHQYSARLLFDLETESSYKARYGEQLKRAAVSAEMFLKESYKYREIVSVSEAPLKPWRENDTYVIAYDGDIAYVCPKTFSGDIPRIFQVMRNAAESVIVQCLCNDYEIPEWEMEMFAELTENAKFSDAKRYWPVLFCDAWWLLKRKGRI